LRRSSWFWHKFRFDPGVVLSLIVPRSQRRINAHQAAVACAKARCRAVGRPQARAFPLFCLFHNKLGELRCLPPLVSDSV
jgi:hypothetical protein